MDTNFSILIQLAHAQELFNSYLCQNTKLTDDTIAHLLTRAVFVIGVLDET